MKKIILSCVLIMSILLTACGKEDNSSKTATTPEDIDFDKVDINNVEWILPYELDRQYYTDLDSLEENSDIIVQAQVVKKLGQEITKTYYNAEFDADLPLNGYTKYQLKAIDVIKGDMQDDELFEYVQSIFVFTDTDDVTKAKFSTNQLPLEPCDQVFLFLRKNDDGSYYAVGDINGIYHKHNSGSPLNEETFHSTKLESYSYTTQCKIYLDVTEKYYKYIFTDCLEGHD